MAWRCAGSAGGRATVAPKAATNAKQCDSAAHQARGTGPRPPLPVGLMQRRDQQGEQQYSAPERDTDLEHSRDVDVQWLELVGAHIGKPMCPGCDGG